MPNTNYFCIKRDLEIVKNGGFWCDGCIIGKPQTEASPDPRYCQGCYEVLREEAELLSNRSRPAWIPKPQKPSETTTESVCVQEQPPQIMSTLGSDKFRVDIIQAVTPFSGTEKSTRGRKRRDVPDEEIRQLNQSGLGSKAIATKLRKELGITVSYKTVQRVLAR